MRYPATVVRVGKSRVTIVVRMAGKMPWLLSVSRLYLDPTTAKETPDDV